MKKLLSTLTILQFTICMAQEIEFTNNGLNVVTIGNKLSDLKSLSFKNVKFHPERINMRFWFEDHFSYYYLHSNSMVIPNVGNIKELFVVPDKSDCILGIFIFIVNPAPELQKILNETFDAPKLMSDSSYNGEKYRFQTFWNKNGISVFLSNTANSKFTKISITKVLPEEKSPGINID